MCDDKDKEIVYDVIVIGLGGVGSFALRSLARGKEGRDAPAKSSSNNNSGSGLSVLGLERFRIGHDLGSSHGGTRLFRHAYFEHPSYVPLCLRSTETFRALTHWKQETANANDTAKVIPLLEDCGVLVMSDGGADGRTYEVIERCSESASMFGIPTQSLDASDLHELYGNSFSITTQENTLKGLLEPGAGFVRPELAIQYALEDAQCHGAEIREGVQVVGIRQVKSSSNNDDETSPRKHSIYAVETSDGHTFRSHGVIVSAGAWASKLLPELDPYLTVTRQIQAWFELPDEDNDADAAEKSKLPPVGWFLDRVQDPISIYGIPADPYSQHPRRSKIALHGRPIPFDPETWRANQDQDDGSFRRPKVTDQELDELKDTVRDWIPGAVDGIVQAKACLYTMTPDEHFLVDRCQELGKPDGESERQDNDQALPSNVWYAAGLSGHGFKMTPALGEALADLVVSGTTDLPVDFLRKDRLLPQQQHE